MENPLEQDIDNLLQYLEMLRTREYKIIAANLKLYKDKKNILPNLIADYQ